MSFSELGLNNNLVASLEVSGYTSPTLLQEQIIPLVKERKDVVVWSQTAAGKTGAFLIPLVNYILDNPLEEHQGARILVLTSRRDRVNQINFTLKKLAAEHSIRSGFISSGRPYQHQMRLLRRPLDFLIATPGRLDDLVKNEKADFSQLEAIVVDDLTSIYYKESHELLSKILAQVKNTCPAVVFAREDDEAAGFVKTLWPKAESIEVEEEKHPLLKVPQVVHIADDHTHKIALMDQMLDERADSSVIIYTATAKNADSLQENLANHGHNAVVVSTLPSPEANPDDFPLIILHDKHKADVTYSAYKHVIQFDLPNSLSSYEERIVNKGWDGEALEEPVLLIVGPHDRLMLKKRKKNSAFSHKAGGKRNDSKTKSAPQKRSATKTASSNNSTANAQNKRQSQRKGPYGRLNGGIHRKRGVADDQQPQANESAGNMTLPKHNDDNIGNSNVNPDNAGNQLGGSNHNVNQGHNSSSHRQKRYVGNTPLSPYNANASGRQTGGGGGYNGGARSQASSNGGGGGFAEENKPKARRVVIRYKDRKKRSALENSTEQDTSE